IEKLFENKSELFTDLKYRRVAVKCLMTLMANWRSAAHDLLHDGGYPSYWGFSTGFWSWDSWKIAAAIGHWEPELAKDHVRALFDYQTEEGMIPDFVSRIKYINNLRDTKPWLHGPWRKFMMRWGFGFVEGDVDGC
ncbi:MAG: MGH1-like glycoside hydrolase domain-containing protein, partial [Butyricimonas paravirosa]